MKKSLLFCGALALTGCASALSHSGNSDHQYYPGTQANWHLLHSDDTRWHLKPLILLDMPFSFLLDTLLLPWDSWQRPPSLKSHIGDPPQPPDPVQ